MRSRSCPRGAMIVLASSLAMGAGLPALLFGSTDNGPPDSLWTEVDPTAIVERMTADGIEPPVSLRAFRLDTDGLRALVDRAPIEGGGDRGLPAVTIALPVPDGDPRRYRIERSPILSPADAARVAGFRTYRVRGVDDPASTGRFSLTSSGLSGLLLTDRGTVRVFRHPASPPGEHGSYYLADLRGAGTCETDEATTGGDPVPSGGSRYPEMCEEVAGFPPRLPAQTGIRTYKIALATREGYTIPEGQTFETHVSDLVNMLNAWFERDLSIRFQPVLDDRLRFQGPDPVNRACGFAPVPRTQCPSAYALDRTACVLQALRDAGVEDFDVGHVLGESLRCPGGVTTIGGACREATGPPGYFKFMKGRGVTNFTSTDRPRYRLLAHEIAHQLGAYHTFSSGTCGSISSRSSYEPGSGSTLMSYAGLCGPDNVQRSSDDYLHIDSIEWVHKTLEDNNEGCVDPAVPVAVNAAPAVSAGGSFAIPPVTPFTISAHVTDGDGDGLSYTWEQGNHDCIPTPAIRDNPGPDPLFRSLPPVSIGPGPAFASRTFEDRGVPGEILPTRRTVVAGEEPIKMRLVARDGAGGVAVEETEIDVVGDPFRVVVSPVHEGAPASVRWDAPDLPPGFVGDSVEILLSQGGGPFVRWKTTPNDGTEFVGLPPGCGTTDNVIRVQATYGDVDDGTSVTVFDDFRFTIFCNCPGEPTGCGECPAIACSNTTTDMGACWDGQDWFVCPYGQTIYLQTCRCVRPFGSTPVCPRQAHGWGCWSR